MKTFKQSDNFFKKRNALKTFGLLSLNTALAGLGISSINDVKEIYKNISGQNQTNTVDYKYTYSNKIELSPILLAQIEEYLEECKKI